VTRSSPALWRVLAGLVGARAAPRRTALSGRQEALPALAAMIAAGELDGVAPSIVSGPEDDPASLPLWKRAMRFWRVLRNGP
jgi:hypothetical protein